jgi:hypothetical protein
MSSMPASEFHAEDFLGLEVLPCQVHRMLFPYLDFHAENILGL